MSQPKTIEMARQGHPQAIAFLINQALQPKGVNATAYSQNNHLYILLESALLPNPEGCIRVIENGLSRLQPATVAIVTIAGQQKGQTAPGWTHTLALKQAPGSSPLQPQPPKHAQQPSPPPSSSVSPQRRVQPAQKAKKSSPPPQVLPVPPHQPSVSSPPPQKQIFKAPPPLPKVQPWLVFGSVALLFIPLSGWVLNSRPERLSSVLERIPQFLTSVATALPSSLPSLSSPSIPQPIPTTATVQNLSQLSNFTLSSLKNPVDPNLTIKIKAVGDIIPGTNYPYNKLPANKENLFKAVKPSLKGADIVFGNFESTLTNYPNSAKSIGRGLVFAFRTPPDYTTLLKDAGFHVLSIANNHSFDFFEAGFDDTQKNIENFGMKAVGRKDQIVYKDVKGVKFAFIGFSNYEVHNTVNDIEAGKALVKKAQQEADIVVISFHAGAEGTGAMNVKNKTEYFYGENRGNVVQFSRSMIDAGADLVLGHGPHVPRALELYQGKLIAYSLGNFMGYRTLSSAGYLGYSLVLEADLNPVGNFISGKILPVHIDSQGIPYPDSQFRSVGLIRNLTQNDFPDTPLEIDKQGQIRIKK